MIQVLALIIVILISFVFGLFVQRAVEGHPSEGGLRSNGDD